MQVNFNTYNISLNKNKNCFLQTDKKSVTLPSFKSKEKLSKEQADSIKSNYTASQNIGKTQIPHITEKDINFEVTCVGYEEIQGNTRSIYDYRVSMQRAFGFDWYKNFKKPSVIRNGNKDEHINGSTTALVIPLNNETSGLRGGDHAAIVFNGNIPTEILSELVVYLKECGIISKQTFGNTERYFLSSKTPKRFFANPKIKTIIADFFRKKETEQLQTATKPEETSSVNNDNNDSSVKLKESDINIVNIGRQQDKSNSREVKDYIREFLKNNKKMTVIYDTIEENGSVKEITVIMIPSKKSDWDCITISLDKRVSQEDCKNLINYLVYNNSANISDENFRKNIVKYFNS